ncbi:hypothetical protein DFH06DRAFT_934062, partial [Mycena polygramma]
SPAHLDTSDLPDGWPSLGAEGDFTGGDLIARELNLRSFYWPGDFLAIRGRIVRHAAPEFEGPQRISMAFFTH